MLLELRRSGGFTGTAKRWRVDAGDDPAWRALVDAAGLPPSSVARRALRVFWPTGASHPDLSFDLWVDGRRSTVRGVDATGAVHDLLDRIMREGEEMGSRPEPSSG
jgi:hypothetical protein